MPEFQQVQESTSGKEILPKQSIFTKALAPFRPLFPWIREEALSNEPLGIIEHPYGIYQPISYFTLWAYFKDSPETIACVTAIIEDIMSDGWRLEGKKDDVEKAQEFLIKNNAKQQFTSMLFDSFVTGDGYLYVKKINTDTLAEKFNTYVKGPAEVKALYFNEILHEVKQENPDILATKEFRYIPSSTVRLDADMHGTVHQYVQVVGSQWRWFRPDEVIHFKLMDLDGKVYGYTPIQSILKEIDIVTNIKDYCKYFFEKGGTPNRIWYLKNETPNSPNVKALKKTLQQYANLNNKWKSLVVTGEIETEMINKLDKDMEFRELARYVTQIIVGVFGVPANRIPGLMYEKGMKTGTLNTEGYYRKIAHWQDVLEDLINGQLLKDYGVKMKFKRTYKQDEIREVQITKIKADAALELYNSGFVNEDWVWRFLEVDEGLRGKPQEPGAYKSPSANQDMLNNHQILSESEEKLAQDQVKQGLNLQGKAERSQFQQFMIDRAVKKA